MSWGKLIGELAKAAASKYVEERSLDGMIEDAGKVASFAKKGFSKVGSKFTAEGTDEEENGMIEIQEWMDSHVQEIEACLRAAARKGVFSKEFEENIQYVLSVGYEGIGLICDAGGDGSMFEDYVAQIQGYWDRAIELIRTKCTGSKGDCNVSKNINRPLSLEVRGVYSAYLDDFVTILTCIVKSGRIRKDDLIKLPTSEHASVKFIGMLGKWLDEAECGDTCAVVLEGDFCDELVDTPFIIGELPDDSAEFSPEDPSPKAEDCTEEEQEYVAELKACLEDDGVISDRERRLLQKLRRSLGISEERAEELEMSLHTSLSLTPEEQEYADEVRACLEDDNVISDKERRLLDKIRSSLGISPDRAKEIEQNLM